MFFESWQGIGRVILVGALAYVGIVLLLRISKKRTLTKMNAFDFVVTVALGSVLATILLNTNVALAEGLTAFAVLIGMQFLVTWLSVRSERFLHVVKSEPTLLYFRGQMLEDVLRSERVNPVEVRAAVRAEGIRSMDEVQAVILETDGTFSVLKKGEGPATAASQDVDNWPA